MVHIVTGNMTRDILSLELGRTEITFMVLQRDKGKKVPFRIPATAIRTGIGSNMNGTQP